LVSTLAVGSSMLPVKQATKLHAAIAAKAGAARMAEFIGDRE
jgi:hypothetical protein